MMRERRKGVREVIHKCMLVVKRGPVAKQTSDSGSFPELVLSCLQSVEDSIKSEDNFNQIMKHDNSNTNTDNDDNDNGNNDDNEKNHDNDDYHHTFEDINQNLNKKNNLYENGSNYVNNMRNNNNRNKYDTIDRDKQIKDERNCRGLLVHQLLAHPATYQAVLDILGNVRQCVCSSYYEQLI